MRDQNWNHVEPWEFIHLFDERLQARGYLDWSNARLANMGIRALRYWSSGMEHEIAVTLLDQLIDALRDQRVIQQGAEVIR
jgi:hypothetical protein